MTREGDSGVRVFGSAQVRVVPDLASVLVAVSRLDPKPAKAFAQARDAAQAVAAYLRKAGVEDVGTSRITLSQETEYNNGTRRFVGYQARLGFNIVLRELDKVDAVIAGLIEAGANELTSVTFETSRLKDLRAEVRRRAVASARAKAELYCDAAGVTAGRVLAIDDVNPDTLAGRREGHSYREPVPAEDDGQPGAIDPGAITITAAVQVLYAIGDQA